MPFLNYKDYPPINTRYIISFTRSESGLWYSIIFNIYEQPIGARWDFGHDEKERDKAYDSLLSLIEKENNPPITLPSKS